MILPSGDLFPCEKGNNKCLDLAFSYAFSQMLTNTAINMRSTIFKKGLHGTTTIIAVQTR